MLASLTACARSSQPPQPISHHLFFRIVAGPAVHGPVSGRLLILLAKASGAKEVAVDELDPEATWVAAREVHGLAPGAAVEVDTDDLAYPQPFSSLASGNYQVQAVLDVDHTYNYSGLTAGDLVSPVLTLTNWTPGEGAEPQLSLGTRAPDTEAKLTAEDLKAASHLRLAEKPSAALSQFLGHPQFIRAWVVLPPDYDQDSSRRYPTVYWTHGFGGTLPSCKAMGIRLYERMAAGKMPSMIWVMLDEHVATGTHEFADSVNNGPWGTALTQEYIPWLESHYRMLAQPQDRFLQGHSSGGWATLQLQIDYPRIFGGTWSTSADSSDFHDFSGVDLYAPHANLYHRPDGTPYPLVRIDGKVIESIEQYSSLERVLGPYGGQMTSFDWVFSPRSADGRPAPMFDRTTGDVDRAVIAYWREHYDLAQILKSRWAQQGRYLKGKIHVYVGTADTFYLDGAAHKLDALLKELGADADFTFREGRGHFDLYADKEDRFALFDTIAARMYLVAYPHAEVKWKTIAAVKFP
jgi:enterochelin esterase-like enzyme